MNYANQQSPSLAGDTSALNARDIGDSAAQNSGVRFGQNVYGRRHGKVRGNDTQDIPAFSITQGQWNDSASQAMRDHVGEDRHAAKRLADILECSPRTAENYLQGRSSPSGIHFLRAYAMIPEFASEVRRLTRMEESLDPEFERDLSSFMERASGYLQRRGG